MRQSGTTSLWQAKRAAEEPATAYAAATEVRMGGAGGKEDGGGSRVFGMKIGGWEVEGAGELMGLGWGAAASAVAERGAGNHDCVGVGAGTSM